MSLKNRIKKIEDKISPPRYAQIEDIIFLIGFEEKKNLSPRDQRRLEEIKDLPIHPDLKKAIREIKANRQARIEDKI